MLIKIFNRKSSLRYIYYIIGVTILMATLFLPTLPVSATPTVAAPDACSIITAKAFQNIYQTGDMLFILEYNLEYIATAVPSYDASELFSVRLMNGASVITNVLKITDADGTIHLPGTVPVEKPLLFYQYNMSSFQFTKADVANFGLVWGTTTYKLEIYGSSSYTFSPAFAPVDYVLNSVTPAIGAKWNTQSDMDLARGNVQSYIINVVVGNKTNGIQSNLSIPGGQYIVTTLGVAVLNPAGRTLVLTAIKDLDTPVPQLFQISTQQIIVTQPSGVAGGLQTGLTLTNQLGSAIATSFTNFGTLLHISGQQVAMGWILLCVLIVISIVFLATGNIIGASICSLPMVLIGVWIGAIPVAFIFVGVMVLVVLLAFYLFIRGM